MIEIARSDRELYKLSIHFINTKLPLSYNENPGTHEEKLIEAKNFVANLNVNHAKMQTGIRYEYELRDADTINVLRIDDKLRYHNSGLYCIIKIIKN